MNAHTPESVRSARSLLFVPGDRPERFGRAVASGADVVVLDLEDAVAPRVKAVARDNARRWLTAGGSAMVRINACATPWHEDDLELILETGAPIMLPKADSADVIEDLPSGTIVVPLIETASGVIAAASVCSANGVQRAAFGSIDLAAELGLDPTDREALLFARASLVCVSAAAGIASPIDGVTTVFGDARLAAEDLKYARRLGFSGKLCIHPSQVAAVHDAVQPSAADVTWARRVIEAADPDRAAIAVDGQMVDRPVLLRAQSVLQAATRGSAEQAR